MEIKKVLEQVYLALVDVTDSKYNDLLNGTDTDDVSNDLFGDDIYYIYNDKKFKLNGHNYFVSFNYTEGDFNSCSFAITFDCGAKDVNKITEAIEELGEVIGISFNTEGMDYDEAFVNLKFDEISKEPLNVRQLIVDFYAKLNSKEANDALTKVLDLLNE